MSPVFQASRWLGLLVLALAANPLVAEDYFRLRGGLANAWHRFQHGGDVRVAFLGGSITHNPGWRDMVCEDLGNRFPRARFDCVNAGIPSMGSTPGAFRLERDVLSRGRIDLLFAEAAVNDSTNGRSPAEMLRGMEGIVRHVRRVNPRTDIVLLHFVDPDKMETIRRGEMPEVIQVHERVAEHYGAPSLDLAREVTERIGAGEFTWEKDFVDLHPSPFGQRLYHRSIARLLDAAWRDPAAQADHPMPAPLDEYSYDRGRLVDIAEAKAAEGFELVASWSPSDGASTRPGFAAVPMLEATAPGATLRFAFRGNAAGIFVAAGPDAGIIEYSVDGGPFERRDLFTRWSSGLHLPWAHVLAAGLPPGPHELNLRLAGDSNPSSQGRAVRIAHFLVNGEPLEEE